MVSLLNIVQPVQQIPHISYASLFPDVPLFEACGRVLLLASGYGTHHFGMLLGVAVGAG